MQSGGRCGARRWSGSGRVVAVLSLLVLPLMPRAVAAIPVFARIYDKPCGTCHTVFPQLNPAGESFRAHGLHGVPPAIEPLKVGPVDVPGALPLALYMNVGEDVTKTDVPDHADPTRTHFNLDYFKLLAGGEIGRHLGFLLDYELIEMEPDSGAVITNSLPHQAYLVAHAQNAQWLGNIKAGWYELPMLISPDIHRLSAHPYLVYALNGCSLLGVGPSRGACEDLPSLEEGQIGVELNAVEVQHEWSVNAGVTNGSNNRLSGESSGDMYLQATKSLGTHRVGLFLLYNPDIVGHGVEDRALRLGPNLDVYNRQLRVLAQFLTAYESNPTGRLRELWYYGGFLEADYRWTPLLLSLLRFDGAWMPRFDDTLAGGSTAEKRRLWEITAGGQWLAAQNLKLIAELSYGENHEAVSNITTLTWSGTVRVVTAFWPFASPLLPNVH